MTFFQKPVHGEVWLLLLLGEFLQGNCTLTVALPLTVF